MFFWRDAGGNMGVDFKPTTGLLRRDQVLAFIIERIARSGTSPSFEEISRALSVSSSRAKELVGQLIERGQIEKTPGGVRSLRVCDVAGARIQLEQVMRNMGWSIAEPMGRLQAPLPNGQLPAMPPFEHLPDID